MDVIKREMAAQLAYRSAAADLLCAARELLDAAQRVAIAAALVLSASWTLPAFAANKEQLQLMADIRMLQEQAQQLQVLIGSPSRGAETAQLLGISVHTVHSHVRNIYGKLSVNSKTEAIYEARQLGLLGP